MEIKKSKKIGTLSLNINTHDFNYGALLHSWAFQKYLEKNNLCEYTEVIDYTTPRFENYNRKNPLIDAIKQHNIKLIIYNVRIFRSYRSRYKKFSSFIKNNLNVSKQKYNQAALNNANLDYDTVICESDVIWSPGFFKDAKFDKTFFMQLDSMKNMKKIAYAPSMADGVLLEEQKQDLIELLKNVDYISCRETYEKSILEKYTDKNVDHVLDPVMLLNSEDYTSIIGKRILPEKYILLYLPVDNNESLRASAIEFAKNNNLKIIEITTNCMKAKGHKTLTDAGIEEFLSAIKYAEVVFTNSFHAICFSLIFNKEFYAFSRNYFGKVKNICEIMGLSERFFENGEFKLLEKIDWEKVNNKINYEKSKSELWLNNALNN